MAERALDGRIRPGVGASPPGPFPGAHEMLAEQRHGRAQRLRRSLDAAVTTTGCETGVLVEAEGELVVDEEVLQGPGQRPCRPARKPGPLQQGLGVVRLAVTKQAPESADHHARPAHAVTVGGEVGEVAQPPGRILDLGRKVVGLVAGTGGMPLPAAAAEQSVTLAGGGAAGDTGPGLGRLWPRLRAGPALAGGGSDEARSAASRAGPLRLGRLLPASARSTAHRVFEPHDVTAVDTGS